MPGDLVGSIVRETTPVGMASSVSTHWAHQSIWAAEGGVLEARSSIGEGLGGTNSRLIPSSPEPAEVSSPTADTVGVQGVRWKGDTPAWSTTDRIVGARPRGVCSRGCGDATSGISRSSPIARPAHVGPRTPGTNGQQIAPTSTDGGEQARRW